MEYIELQPIAMTHCHWDQLTELCKKHLDGLIPTRGLDTDGISLRDPAAFLGSINLKNKPLDALREYSRVNGHFYFTMFAVCDDELIQQVSINSDLHITKKQMDNVFSVIIITGTVSDWKEYIVTTCGPDNRDWFGAREFARRILEIFKKTQLNQCFSNLKLFKHWDDSLGVSYVQ